MTDRWSQAQLASQAYWRSRQVSSGASSPPKITEEMKAQGIARKLREQVIESKRLQAEINEVWD